MARKIYFQRSHLAFLGSSRPFPEPSTLLPEDDWSFLEASKEEDECGCCNLLLVAFRMDSSLASSLSDAIVGTFGMPRLVGSITMSGCSVWP